MNKINHGLLCNVEMYTEMLKAYVCDMVEFEYAGSLWDTNEVFIDFERDMKRGLLKLEPTMD